MVMANNRCANPEYQLDVDVLILEYLLYQTLRASFVISHTGDGHTNGNPSQGSPLDQVQTFDLFMRLFRTRHPAFRFTAGTDFNLSILQTLVLFLDPELEADSSIRSLPLTALDTQKGDAELATQIEQRKQWLELRKTAQGDALNVEQNIFNSFDMYGRDYAVDGESVDYSRATRLFCGLHRFMLVSAEMASVMEGREIGEDLMRLMCEMMLQTAAAMLSTEIKYTGKPRDTNCLTLEHIFAFGYVHDGEHHDSTPFSSGINAMFSSASSPKHTSRTVLAENPLWTELRQQTILKLRLAQRNDSPHPSPKAPALLQEIRRQHPWATFEEQLVRCLNHFWELNCSPELSGKPELVQIEEGGLYNLSRTEFDDFLVRCGVREGRKGEGLLVQEFDLEKSLWLQLHPQQMNGSNEDDET